MGSIVEQALFRANPSYVLVALDHLTPTERADFAGFGGFDNDLYGLLRPRPGSRLELRAVSSDTALLFLTLMEPGSLPGYVRARLGADVDRAIARLVVDGVLELEHEGEYVCGARGGEVLLPRRSYQGRGRNGDLSVAALRYGQELDGLSESSLAPRLYFYGRRPLSPELAHRFPDDAAVATYLGIDCDGSARQKLDAGWIENTSAVNGRRYWRQWRARPVPGDRSRRSTADYKLYVSPATEALGTVFSTVAGVLTAARGVVAFKVGGDLAGICRPDKLVVYFDHLDDLREGAAKLEAHLAGCPAQGVAFAAAVTDDGLLSWGVDPPRTSPGITKSTTWRMWMTARLAEYLVAARGADLRVIEPWQYALDRLRLTGVDTDNWTPAVGTWREMLKDE